MILDAEMLGAIAGFLQVIAAIAVAYMVHKLTQQLGTVEHRREIDNGWQTFNSLVVQNRDAQAYVMEREKFASEQQAVAAYMTFMQLNQIYEAWHGIDDRLPLQKFAGNLIRDHIRLLATRDAAMLEYCLDGRGYSDDFLEHVETLAKDANPAFRTRVEKQRAAKQ
jgi:hypothetical protein